MKLVFFDTGAQFALLSRDDKNQQRVAALVDELQAAGTTLVMTDYVFNELLTLITARAGKHKAIEYAAKFPANPIHFQFIGLDDFYEGKRIFERYRDKNWSFTDCVSFAFMRRLGITTALSFDRDFTQAGFNLLK